MLILKNAHILTMAGVELEQGDIALEGDKIVAIGRHIPSGGDLSMDLAGKWIMPGIVDAHSHIGLINDGTGRDGEDVNEMTCPNTAHLRAIDGINPFDHCFVEAYEHGVTSVVTGPGSANVIAGQFAALKTYGRCVEEMVIREPVAVKVAFGENPKNVYGSDKKAPSTRMATAGILREALLSAQEYGRKRRNPDESKRPEKDLRKEALLLALEGKVPLKAHAHRADDILTALRIAKEFGCDITLDHCTEGYLIADLLKEADAKIIIGPLICERSKIELKNLTFQAPRLLHEAGLKFAIMTDHPVVPCQHLSVMAAIAVREGLDERTALESITINAAQITGISDRVGSLEIGKDADLAVYSGHPLDVRSRVEMTIINGRIVFDRRSRS